MQSSSLMVVVAANLVVLIHLIAGATETFVSEMSRHTVASDSPTVRRDYEATRLRLEVFWTIALIATTALAIKMVLPADLADQLIAAWFVGQGFALQPYVQSFISGISLRNNSRVWARIFNEAPITIFQDDKKYILIAHSVFSVTLKAPEERGDAVRVLSWRKLTECTIGMPH